MRGRKYREDFRLRETERIWDAVDLNHTYVKDYSLEHIVKVVWRSDDFNIRKRLVKIEIGSEWGLYSTLTLNDAIEQIAEDDDKNSWWPRYDFLLMGYDTTQPLTVDLTDVNFECLRDHVGKVTIGANTAIIDLEELLKAIRYA